MWLCVAIWLSLMLVRAVWITVARSNVGNDLNNAFDTFLQGE